uniref:Uncharacterized protein n=1 Tax=Arundo donax TaxID=35708 RepID=A0A0A9BTL2_ARUDO
MRPTQHLDGYKSQPFTTKRPLRRVKGPEKQKTTCSTDKHLAQEVVAPMA